MPSEEHGLGCTARMARLYRQFGHFLAARKDTASGSDELLVCDYFVPMEVCYSIVMSLEFTKCREMYAIPAV